MAASCAGSSVVMSGSVPSWWREYAREFPQYTVWRGTNQLYYASRTRANPPVIIRGESADDLADMIRAEERRRES